MESYWCLLDHLPEKQLGLTLEKAIWGLRPVVLQARPSKPVSAVVMQTRPHLYVQSAEALKVTDQRAPELEGTAWISQREVPLPIL